MKILSLSVNGDKITAPAGIPTGGLSTTGTSLVNLAVQYVFLAGMVLAIIFVLISGIQWITSGGDEKQIEKARGRLTYAIIGLIVILGSFFIIKTTLFFFGADPLWFFPETNTSQVSCSNSATGYVYCGNGRYVCGTTDPKACN